MTTVRELIHQLTANYVDLDAEVQVLGPGWNYFTDVKVTSRHVGGEAPVVRIEPT